MVRRVKVSVRNARFQQWEAMLTNRSKRSKLGSFLVHGVRPITLAIEHGWDIQTLLYDCDRRLSQWAEHVLDNTAAEQAALTSDLMAQLGEKADGTPELIAQVALPSATAAEVLRTLSVGPQFLGLVFDRPTSPGNVGSLIRSADAFGADVVILTGHAADPFDPKSVRASTGSLFAVPLIRAESAAQVSSWARGLDVRPQLIGTDEHGDSDMAKHDFTSPTLLLIGNETRGLSHAWKEQADHLVRIPMSGSASSLNAASAAAIALYEVVRQRG
ncbi:TrmH family RNA methyltransferase [Natronoglycomyces albus]|uniref:rRNA methyltransferase n=1 Tax=Natronoglycomyces albus TaxID=2811108 RepID=A0A895XS49_9ACTN|nr:TrmH family RNA methyltransferase [Natronoglycomyces albus]QSB04458.1 hypothetical protein JQS30_11770 [Natronoglycomyces albus]